MFSSLTTPSELDHVARLRLLVQTSQQLGVLQQPGEHCRGCPSRLAQMAELNQLQRQLFETIASQLPSSPPPGAA